VQIDFNFVIEPVRTLVLDTAIVSAPGEGSGESQPPRRVDGSGPSVDLRAMLESAVSVAGTLTGTVTTAVTSAIGLVVQSVLVLFLSFLFLLEIPRIYHGFFHWTPEPYHREYILLIDRVLAVWNGFFRGQVIIGLIVGLFTWGQFRLLGVPGAEVIGVFTGFVSLIPTLGGFIALPPMVIVPLLQGSTVFPDLSNGTVALIVVVINLAFQQVIWNALAPAIVGQAVDLPLPVILIGLFIGAAFGGILGAFLVAPIMGTLRVLLIYIFHKLNGRDPYPNAAEPLMSHEGIFAPPGQVQQPALRG
jgi:predicted PurR-regulated permease PerM